MKAGRRKLVCNKCGAQFSTHSTDRNMCYKCKDYCRDKHFFFNTKPKTIKKADEKKTA